MTPGAAYRVALVGNPNCGKSALFNALTGGRQKVGNYPGVTVERRVGRLQTPSGMAIDLIDLPGSYSLTPHSADEEVTNKVILGQQAGELPPDAILCVVDATNLAFHLPLVLELKRLGKPMLLTLNMNDLAERDGISINVDALSSELGMPVVRSVAVRKAGTGELIDALSRRLAALGEQPPADDPALPSDVRSLRREARRIAAAAIESEGNEHKITRILDQIFLNRVAGPAILFGLLFLMFQAVFSWAETPMNWIDAGVVGLQQVASSEIANPALQSLLVDGILAGVGSVVIFLPQILILFLFILVLEASGYMARAAFLMDRLMAGVGLNGRAFIPLLSSFACAIPGIMAARTIDSQRDRLTTIMVAPLMTCSARLPVYTLIIAAFIPNRTVLGAIGLQGLVMFSLYVFGIVAALVVAAVLKRTMLRGEAQPLLLELPKYQMPIWRDVAIGLWQRVKIFMRRAGGIILISMIVLWALSSFPPPPEGATQPPIYYSAAAWVGKGLQTIFAPIGFNWEISIALIPGLAAREVAVAALGTVYALSGTEDAVTTSLVETLRGAWTLPTALSFLVWYVFAPQCLSTLAVAKRETNSWRWTLFMAGYLFALAYAFSFVTYWTAKEIVGL
ncbi:ferrous iron transport protein B [Emcibacter sp. SYSU 3D8]|uniref:ferrous iron transport protein B n=1 Tax=Emcibacter sp. SYSU 3D8 TaxID=3133969 RepID=UPI0031FE5E19